MIITIALLIIMVLVALGRPVNINIKHSHEVLTPEAGAKQLETNDVDKANEETPIELSQLLQEIMGVGDDIE